ncbi:MULTISPECIES: LysR family transcriptional regulator [Rhodococcus]|jgi:LysR family transcriptional activator of glutamate synthase operon|uniref:LysR family transcriptional regulator n=1 Tax=Rhodococcus TaxID=1827 RepID=UPI0015625E82|nr:MULTISPECIES: LysR family transcriptional regulator [Rhodococcus]MDV8066846.1 LysR family transcriptional regulator [Rhodococcus sp. IEGM 1366]QXW05705.1 LysR family transcriptional regulator [Rhodococcus globerulus]
MLSDDLEWFVVLAETQQVTATADITHLSQPTLSRKLARLERSVGVPLFDRHGRRLTLNRYGRILYEHATSALNTLHSALRQIDALAGPDTGTVRLDFLHSFGTWLIPRMIRAYRTEHPGVRFELHQDRAQFLSDRVITGDADLALVSPQPDNPRLAWTQIAQQKLALAVPLGHRFADLPEVDLADAAGEQFIGMQLDFGMRRILDEMCAAAGFTPDFVFESSELATVGGLVSASLGVAVMPIQDPPIWAEGIVFVPLAGATRKIGLVWTENRELSRPARDFRDFVRENMWS